MYSDLIAKRICHGYGFEPNHTYTFKCFMVRNPGRVVFSLLFITIFVNAYIVRIFERPYYYAV